MKTSHFEDAPQEILQLIFEESSKDDLFRLSLVNKRFRWLLEPQLYHTIDWVWEKESIPPITLLLRTILARPELATYIQKIKLTGETFHLPPFRMKQPPRIPVPLCEIDQLVAVVKKLEVPNSEQWIDMLRGGGIDQTSVDANAKEQRTGLATMDAVLAILLSRLPNLTSLHLGPNFAKETTILGGMFKYALCCENIFGFSNFEKLKEVYFSPRICIERCWGTRGNETKPENSLCALTFFSAPNIEHITTTIEEPETFKWPGNTPSPSTLTSLDITLLREGTLRNVLDRCTNLHTLTYNFYADKASAQSSDRVQRSLTPVLDGSNLMGSLYSVKRILKSLSLTAFITEHDYDGHEGNPSSIDIPISLRGSFSRLENLQIPTVFLLGYEPPEKISLGDVLPENVQSVTLTDDTWWGRWGLRWGNQGDGSLLDTVEEWFDNWKEYTPRLNRVCVVITEMDPWDPELVQRFQNMGVQAGLEVEYKEIDQEHWSSWPRLDHLSWGG